MSLTVSEILALEELSPMRLRAGKQGLQLAVRWYYVAENENIAEWIMGGELVFITGINHPRDEDNLIHLLMEGKQRGIAGMVILTGDAYIQAIPPRLIALADALGIPLIEQPYLLKMVIVTERIGTALVRSENALQSQRLSTQMISSFVALSVALGIASVLAVSVVQRTREIGILRAMGASRQQMLRVFLLQGAMFGLVGSLLGSLASYGLVAIFNNFSAQLFYIPLDPWLALLAAGLATATGIVAAAIPARRAATLDPVQAIRHV